MKSVKKNKGQYFTTNEMLQKKVFDFILNKPSLILEPSVGRGDLVKYVKIFLNVKWDLFEIDNEIKPIIDNKIVYTDFLKYNIEKKYNTIIGNPPYVKTLKGNLYIDFISKCYNLLKPNGELIFIIPSVFFKLTRCKKLLNKMTSNGNFTHLYHPHKENLFKNATVDVLVMRYNKTENLKNEMLYNGKTKYIYNSEGLVWFLDKNVSKFTNIGENFNVYVGMVSGKENVFKDKENGNVKLISGKDKKESYILINDFPCENEYINKKLLLHKDDLINRKIKKFNEKNWFQWGALRNIKTILQNRNKECLYIYNLTRKKDVCFKGKVDYFGGNLLILIPKGDINLEKCVVYFNSEEFKEPFMYSGRFKIGQRQLCNTFFDIF